MQVFLLTKNSIVDVCWNRLLSFALWGKISNLFGRIQQFQKSLCHHSWLFDGFIYHLKQFEMTHMLIRIGERSKDRVILEIFRFRNSTSDLNLISLKPEKSQKKRLIIQVCKKKKTQSFYYTLILKSTIKIVLFKQKTKCHSTNFVSTVCTINQCNRLVFEDFL